MSHYVPPYQITTAILNRIAEISERLGRWAANHNINHLLDAHHTLMRGLLDDAGQFRTGGIGIYRGKR